MKRCLLFVLIFGLSFACGIWAMDKNPMVAFVDSTGKRVVRLESRFLQWMPKLKKDYLDKACFDLRTIFSITDLSNFRDYVNSYSTNKSKNNTMVKKLKSKDLFCLMGLMYYVCGEENLPKNIDEKCRFEFEKNKYAQNKESFYSLLESCKDQSCKDWMFNFYSPKKPAALTKQVPEQTVKQAVVEQPVRQIVEQAVFLLDNKKEKCVQLPLDVAKSIPVINKGMIAINKEKTTECFEVQIPFPKDQILFLYNYSKLRYLNQSQALEQYLQRLQIQELFHFTEFVWTLYEEKELPDHLKYRWNKIIQEELKDKKDDFNCFCALLQDFSNETLKNIIFQSCSKLDQSDEFIQLAPQNAARPFIPRAKDAVGETNKILLSRDNPIIQDGRILQNVVTAIESGGLGEIINQNAKDEGINSANQAIQELLDTARPWWMPKKVFSFGFQVTRDIQAGKYDYYLNQLRSVKSFIDQHGSKIGIVFLILLKCYFAQKYLPMPGIAPAA